jgi:hypothetical protein
MSVDERDFREDAIDPRGNRIGLRESGNGKKEEESDSGNSMHAADCSSEGRRARRRARQCSPALGAALGAGFWGRARMCGRGGGRYLISHCASIL